MASTTNNTYALHQPVMLNEVLEFLDVKPKHWYIDATFGRGGHTQAILDKQGNVLAIDQDQEAIKYAQQQFEKFINEERLIVVQQNFSQLTQAVSLLPAGQAETAPITGILFDFGTSLDQIRAPSRGFSFDRHEDPLDMRMNQELGVTAADLLTVLSKKQLADMFKELGGESQANKIASAIDRHRGKDRSQRITTVGELLKIIDQVKERRSHLHPATKVFQALRIAVNSELDSIKQALPQALDVLVSGGAVVTIAFHQGEDSIVKHLFKEWEQEGKGEILSKKPLQPSAAETSNNPSARSAKLRAFKKI